MNQSGAVVFKVNFTGKKKRNTIKELILNSETTQTYKTLSTCKR